MNFTYREAATEGLLRLLDKPKATGSGNPIVSTKNLLTIAWNQGPEQQVLVDGVAHHLGKNQLILLVYHHRVSFSEPDQLLVWRFNREFYCIVDHDAEVGCAGLLFFGMPSPMILQLEPPLIRKLDLLYQVFTDEFATHDNIQGEMLRMLLKRLIILLPRLAKEQHLKAPPEGDELDIIRRFNLLVEANYQRLHQVQDYADLLHKSPKTLSNLFGKYSDKSPLRIIRERIALDARRQLRFTDKTIGEIGFDLGFQESAHFSRFFKQLTGQSPNAFRLAGKN